MKIEYLRLQFAHSAIWFTFLGRWKNLLIIAFFFFFCPHRSCLRNWSYKSFLIFNFQVRHRLKKNYGIEGGIPVVFSLEKPTAKLLPFKGPSGEEENPSDYQVKKVVNLEHILLFTNGSFSDFACTNKFLL